MDLIIRPQKNTIKLKLLAIALGLTPLLVLEAILNIPSFAPPTRTEWSRQFGVASIENQYILYSRHVVTNPDDTCGPPPELTKTGDSSRDMMQPASFSCKPNGKRVVILGGSSVQGFGLKPEETLSSVLSKITGVEFINLGVAGYNTTQIRRFSKEIWTLQPDLILIYAGHNDHTYYPLVKAALETTDLARLGRTYGDRLAIWRFTRGLLQNMGFLPGPTPKLVKNRRMAAYTLPPLPDPDGNELIKLINDQTQAKQHIARLYKENIQIIKEQADLRGIKLMLVTPVCRLDSEPSGSMHWHSDRDLTRWRSLFAQLQDPELNDPLLIEALQIDDTYSALRYKAGLAAKGANKPDLALEHFRSSLDYMPPTRSDRAPPSFGNVVLKTAKDLDIYAIDIRSKFYTKINQKPFFIDSLHLSPVGIELLADGLAPAVIDNLE